LKCLAKPRNLGRNERLTPNKKSKRAYIRLWDNGGGSKRRINIFRGKA